MSRVVLVLANDRIRQRAVHWIMTAEKDTRVEFKRPRRTLDQNAKFWAMLGDISKQYRWHGATAAAEEVEGPVPRRAGPGTRADPQSGRERLRQRGRLQLRPHRRRNVRSDRDHVRLGRRRRAPGDVVRAGRLSRHPLFLRKGRRAGATGRCGRMSAPVRIQLRRTKGWRMPPNTVVVSRPSKWGNPHDWRDWLENADRAALPYASDRELWCKEQAAEAYFQDVRDGVIAPPFQELRGRNVACWCATSRLFACHGDYVLRLANAP